MPELDDTDALLRRYATPKPDLNQVCKGLNAYGWICGDVVKEHWNTDNPVWWFDVGYGLNDKRTDQQLIKDLRDFGVWHPLVRPHQWGHAFSVRIPRKEAYVKQRMIYPGTKLGFDMKIESVDDPDADVYLTDLDRLGMLWNKMDQAAMDVGWTLRKVIGKPPYKRVYLKYHGGDTRWWMYVQHNFKSNTFEVWFEGQKLFQDQRGDNYWEDFEIEAGLELNPGDDFVAALDQFDLDEGPDEPTINEPDVDDRDESAPAIVARLLETDVPSEDDPDLLVPKYASNQDIRGIITSLQRKGWEVSHPWKENWEHPEDAAWVFAVSGNGGDPDVSNKLYADMSTLVKVGATKGFTFSPFIDAIWVRVPRNKAFYSWRRGKME